MNIRKFIKIILCVILSISVLNPMNLYAGTKDVTNSMKKDAGVKAICKHINMYVSVICEWNPNATSGKVKMSTPNKFDIVGLSIMGNGIWSAIDSEDTYQGESFYYHALKSAKFKKIYRKLFGENANIEKTELSGTGTYTIKKGNKLYIPVGDWGMSYPTYKIKKVEKLSSNEYRVTIMNRFKYEEDGNYNYTDEGITKIRIKKSSKSDYGYKVIGISYKRNT